MRTHNSIPALRSTSSKHARHTHAANRKSLNDHSVGGFLFYTNVLECSWIEIFFIKEWAYAKIRTPIGQ
jgi:hypothetical protein